MIHDPNLIHQQRWMMSIYTNLYIPEKLKFYKMSRVYAYIKEYFIFLKMHLKYLINSKNIHKKVKIDLNTKNL